MHHTDPIADFLTHIRNAVRARHQDLELPNSKMKQQIAEILKKEGFVADYQIVPQKPQNRIRVRLKYRRDGSPILHEIRRISRPGCRRYANVDDLKGSTTTGIKVTILSTPRGIMTNADAIQANVGGEILCRVF